MLLALALGDDEVAHALGVGNAFEFFDGIGGGGGGEGEVADVREALAKALVDVDGADVADEEFAQAAIEEAALDDDAVVINAHDGLAALDPGDEPRDDQPGKKEVPKELPPGGAHFQEEGRGGSGLGRGRRNGLGGELSGLAGNGIAAFGTGHRRGGNRGAAFRTFDQCHNVESSLHPGG